MLNYVQQQSTSPVSISVGRLPASKVTRIEAWGRWRRLAAQWLLLRQCLSVVRVPRVLVACAVGCHRLVVALAAEQVLQLVRLAAPRAFASLVHGSPPLEFALARPTGFRWVARDELGDDVVRLRALERPARLKRDACSSAYRVSISTAVTLAYAAISGRTRAPLPALGSSTRYRSSLYVIDGSAHCTTRSANSGGVNHCDLLRSRVVPSIRSICAFTAALQSSSRSARRIRIACIGRIRT